ncbi:MAG: VWA domain-containing protein [Deltaproteobacteria bacterium]|nr:VWA domain-containing protein [Deltaproteobacteria bacterium]
MIKPTIGFLFTAILIVGCGSKSGGQGDDSTEVDAGLGADCTDNSQCSADAPICSSSGVCVQCESSADCSDPTPVCSNTTCTAACAGTDVMADFVTKPSDIIFIVDQSGSMDQETVYVQMKINDFVTQISASNIDYRVVMIATTSGSNAICVPSPLANGSCGNNTRFRLVNQRIGSNDGPALTLSRYALYSDFLRPEAAKHFVFVTDDNSNMSAANFTTGVNNLMPAGMFTGFKVHGIYAYGSGNNGCTGTFGSGAADGTVYTTLINQTMGARGVICTGNWTQVFSDIQQAVVSGAQVSCDLTIPAPPMGETLDPTKVNVKYQMGGVAPGMTLSQVSVAADCTSAGGWYYDDNAAPMKITLCPATCASVQADPSANVKVEFGCSTQIF